jgi:predicted N-acetyltransferase YhbS
LDNDLKIEPLGPQHDRAAFSSGSAPLDQYLKTQANQAAGKNLAAVFVLTRDGKTILGYFTLSAFSIKLSEIPEPLARKLTKMGEVPATLLGRLARSLDQKGKGIGEILLVDALKKALQNNAVVASWTVVVDAKDDNASAFYKRFGFLEFPSTPKRLFLPMKSIEQLFAVDNTPESASSVAASSEVTPRG